MKSVLSDNGNSLAAVQANYVFTILAPVTIITVSSPPNGQLPGGEVSVAYFPDLGCFRRNACLQMVHRRGMPYSGKTQCPLTADVRLLA